MRRMAWLLAVAGVLCLTLGLAGAAERDTYQSAKDAAAESKARAEAAKKKNSHSWWWPFGSSEKKESKATVQVEKKPTPDKPPQAKPISAPLGLEGANLIASEQGKFLRRQQVCDAVREAAVRKGDTNLEKQAQLTEQRAWFIYEQRTAQARMPNLLPLADGQDARKLAAEPPLKGRAAGTSPVHSIYARNPGAKNGGEE